jgi:hypothetical protein
MNTRDIRNMEVNQWVFWATALPLTVIIITLCLIWTGELENFWRGFRNLWGGDKKKLAAVQYSMPSRRTDAYSMLDPRADSERFSSPAPAIINNRMGYEEADMYRRPRYGYMGSRTYDDEGW